MICSNDSGKIDCHPATAEELHRLEKSKPQIPNTPLTTEQKALLDGTAPNPESVNPNVANGKTVETTVPLPAGAIISDTQGVREHPAEQNLESEGLARRNDVELERQREQLAAQERSIQQQNYQAGYAIGQRIGTAVNSAVLRHKITKWCKERPGLDHGVQLANGQSIHCDEWNTGNHEPSSAAVLSAEQVKIQHEHAIALQNMQGLHEKTSISPKLGAPPSDSRMRGAPNEMYIAVAMRGAKYTDLTGADQTCR